jgi:hypothetical protein
LRLLICSGSGKRLAFEFELAQTGFEADDTPTARGRELEDLIDGLARIDPDF